MPGHQGGRAGRVARWRDRFWQRMADTKSDLDRVGVAVDHLRLALTKCASTEQRTAVTATTVADLVAAAEDLFTRYETRGRRS